MSEANLVPNRRLYVAIAAGFSVYFSLLFVGKFFPALAASGTFGAFSFAVLLPTFLLTLVVLPLFFIWGLGAFFIASLRKRPLGKISGALLRVGAIGLASLFVVVTVGSALPQRLPKLIEFDRMVWIDPKSAELVSGDITPRQKMLGNVVEKLPGKNRQELEALLGPSLDTSYFASTGRDLIYVVGPERDGFFSIDSEWLIIWLDPNGQYQRHAVVVD